MDTTLGSSPCHICTTAYYEFLICGSLCVAVRERDSGEWLEDHYAVDERVSLVPRSGAGGSMSRWNMQICTFGNTVQVGPLEHVARADASLCQEIACHLGKRYRVTGPEADDLEVYAA